jgi:tRNA nucleotidyltransferase (CCA-adding enzyme)
MKHLGGFPPYLLPEIKEIINLLSPHTKRAYFVGGCVRDLLLKNKIKDIDIEVYDIAPETFDSLMQSVGALGVGKSFFVYKYKNIDLAMPRIEQKNGTGHKAFEVSLIQDEKIASKRRDFSMNALMQNIFDGEFLDFWGGVSDIHKKLIRLIDVAAFREDSLRVLRAVGFASRFDFQIEEKTLAVMRKMDLSDLSKTRVFWELQKFFFAKHLHIGLRYFYELGLFEKIFSLHVNSFDVANAVLELEDIYKEKELDEYYFLYITSGILCLNIKELLGKLEVPNSYHQIFRYQPFIKNPTDKELLEIAMHIPIKRWLGNYQKGIKERAVKLGVFESIYTGGVDIQDVIKEGFEKEDIKKEYERRVLESISKKI